MVFLCTFLYHCSEVTWQLLGSDHGEEAQATSVGHMRAKINGRSTKKDLENPKIGRTIIEKQIELSFATKEHFLSTPSLWSLRKQRRWKVF